MEWKLKITPPPCRHLLYIALVHNKAAVTCPWVLLVHVEVIIELIQAEGCICPPMRLHVNFPYTILDCLFWVLDNFLHRVLDHGGDIIEDIGVITEVGVLLQQCTVL